MAKWCYSYVQVRSSGKRSREVYTDTLCNIAKKFKSTEQQAALIAEFPSYDDVRIQLSRHRAVRCTPVPDPLNIPDSLRVTLRGREALDSDPNKNEQFLLYSGQGGRLLVFCAGTELATVHQSEYLVCDGTFEMTPQSSYQLYTIHGYLCGEGLPLTYAIMPNKTTDTYVEMFTALRSAVVAAYGDVGSVRYVLMDFELAAINAVRQVFPEVSVKGCTFHFRQAIMRRIKQVGLQQAYDSETTFPELRRWMRYIMSLCLLPAFAIPLVWEVLEVPPVSSPELDAKAKTLAEYFRTTWIAGDFPPCMWSHFDHCGPRTTNLAEGFHNSLNSRFGMPHPSMRTFLDWLQKGQYETQCREMQLNAGRPPKQRVASYVKNDAEIAATKFKYSMDIGRLFAYSFPQADSWQRFYNMSLEFLARVSHLIGLGV